MQVNFDHLLPDGETLFPYQQVGVGYALVATADGGGAWIADEQGLGKTRQAIVVAKAKGAKRILIIAKDSLKANWEREISICAPEWSCQVVRGSEPYEPYCQAVIIGFHLLSAWADALISYQFDALIVDESHYVKSAGTAKHPVQRTVAALKIADDIRFRRGLVLLLSGTPILNRPIELITQLQMIGRLKDVAPKPYRGDSDAAWEKAFKGTFCWNGKDYKGSMNRDLLNLRLRSKCYVRRLRNEVLSLDDTHRIHTPLSLNGGLDAYRRIEDNFSPAGPGAYLKLLTDLRLAVGLAKIPAAVDWCEDFVDENPGKKLVVWAWHIEVQKGIAAALNRAGIKAIYWKGARNDDEIEQLKRDFNAGDAQVIVCSLQAHREGHTLVGDGNNVTDSLFVESPWGPGAVSQAEDRINRIGREAAAVFAHTLVVPDTVDQWLVDLISEKWEVFKGVANGTIVEGEDLDIQNLLLGKLRAKFPALEEVSP